MTIPRSTRLNRAIRDQIVENALTKSGINTELETLTAEKHEWAEAVRVHVNGATDKTLLQHEKNIAAVIAGLPKNVRPYAGDHSLSRGTADYVNLGGLKVRIEFYDAAGEPEDRIRTTVRLPVVVADHKLAKQFHDMEARRTDIAARGKTLEAQVRAVVNSATTVGKLLDVWPESIELLPTTLGRVLSNLPAVVVSDLNRMVGLPSEHDE